MFRHRGLVLGAVLGILATAVPLLSEAQFPGDRLRGSDLLQLRERVERFLQRISEQRIDDAYDELLAESLIREDRQQMIDLMQKTRTALARLDRYGLFVDVESVRVERAGSSLVYVQSLYKTERLPMIWYFTFYRSHTEADWVLVTVRFDTELEGLFQE